MASAGRQPNTSVRSPVNSLPLIPPMLVPLIYKPIIFPRPFGSNSSPTYVIATAGTPARKIPSSPLIAKSAGKAGLNAVNRPKTEVAVNDSTINFFLPNPSDNEAAANNENAKTAVEMDKVKLAAAAEI